MSNYSKPKCKPHDPCKAQLYKTVKYQYYRYPVKYICVPVEWDTKCEKHVYWEPQKPYPPVKVPCEELRQKYGKDEKRYEKDEMYYGKDEKRYEKDEMYYGKDEMYYGKEKESYQAPEYGYEQEECCFKQDGYAQEYQDEEEDGGYQEFEYSGN